jgi:hypothetical protein
MQCLLIGSPRAAQATLNGPHTKIEQGNVDVCLTIQTAAGLKLNPHQSQRTLFCATCLTVKLCRRGKQTGDLSSCLHLRLDTQQLPTAAASNVPSRLQSITVNKSNAMSPAVVHVLPAVLTRLYQHAGEQKLDAPACGWLVGAKSNASLHVVGTLCSLTQLFGISDSKAAVRQDYGEYCCTE